MNAVPGPGARTIITCGAVVGLLCLSLSACGSDSASPESTDEAATQGPAAEALQAQSFVTRPDLAPPQIEFTDVPAAEQRTGQDEYYFLSPGYEDDAEPGHGAGIYGAEGELVWMQPADGEGDDNFFDVRV
ncbi:hypothetical protein JRG18_06520 [Kocuria palustris]|uniref:hypothetical protein n=1 Tax=Kocuria palustris TaxID=71999 RepID=UPI0019CFBD60|nr:hypothetical protein [Kocuria palustris]MBN6753355.1 hypothetical protein [Kocuria palustris]MBN6758130.1 hypothetical protein [Kocuria palustris]MBN6763158.1 hypothetical protein [Kocuria palustris]MBN6782860.1 hypothetical protein [Kocuria palustris]MBN6798997.1 hypothetical protein [Kocuria palustris]